MTEADIEIGTFTNSVHNVCEIISINTEIKEVHIQNLATHLHADVPFDRVINHFKNSVWKNFVPKYDFDLGELQ